VSPRSVLLTVTRACARRPAIALGSFALLALAGAVLALGLPRDTSTNTIVGSSSPAAQAAARQHASFGDDAVDILVRQPIRYTVLTADLGQVTRLEGCLSGNVPAGAQPFGARGGPCWQLAASHPAQVVYGPGTFLFEAVERLVSEFNTQAQATTADAQSKAAAAQRVAAAEGRSRAQQLRIASEVRSLVQAQFLQQLATQATRYGISSVPRIDDPKFISQIVFDPSRAPGCPKARFAFLFPTCDSSLIQARLSPGLSQSQRDRAITLIRQAARLDDFALQGGGSYLVSGGPVVVRDLSQSLTGSIERLLVVALVAMALTLALVFPAPRRLLALAVAVGAVAITFGLLRLVGARLTMASVAALPVLGGLAVDYAIQFHARWVEAREVGYGAQAAALRAVSAGGPLIATAAAATAAGMLALLLSPVPMVRGFGGALVAGVLIAFSCALTAGLGALALSRKPDGDRRRASEASRWVALRSVATALSASARGAGELLASSARRLGRTTLATRAAGGATRAARHARDEAVGLRRRAIARPAPVLAVGLLLAALGWAADTQSTVVSDVTRLVPAGLPAIRDLNALQKATNAAGEADVLVEGPNVAAAAVVRWMRDYQTAVLKRSGYSAAAGCQRDVLCPALSLTDLFQSDVTLGDQGQIDAILRAVPPYFARAVITPDRHQATLAFGVRLQPLARQQQLFAGMRSALRPPPGIRATLTGLPVLTAQADADLASTGHRALTLILGLALVALVLLATAGWATGALVPLVPIVLATGWSALLLFVLGVALNPMSVALEAMTVAIATEFSVLLTGRFRAERRTKAPVPDALERTWSSTGRAVLASATTAIAGFAVLVTSDIRMLRSFGLVAVVDLAVALAAVMIVLPAALVLVEDGVRPVLRSDGLRRALRARRLGARRTPVA